MPFGRREPFKCIETDEIFTTKADAAKHCGISIGSVQDSLRDGKSHMGYTFVYVADLSKVSLVGSEQPDGDWVDIPGYEGLYQITSSGLVWSIPRIVGRCTGRSNVIRGKLLNVAVDDAGYCSVSLTDSSHKTKRYLLHRLVAQVFLPNPDNKPEINHKDGNKSNNCVDNLEWATRYENQYHASISGLSTAWTSAHGKKMSDAALTVNNKPVLCVTTGEIFESRVSACKALGLGKDAVYISIKENRAYNGYVFKEVSCG